MATETSTRAVVVALLADLGIAAAKLVAWGFTGSASVLSEAIHSLVDVLNQSLLAIGLRQADRGPTAEYPYGYRQAVFVWALMSAVGVLLLGCGITTYHGVTTILEPEPLHELPWAFGVLAVALLLDGTSFVNGIRQSRRGAKEQGQSLRDYLLDGANTVPVAVVMEDGAALLGVVIAVSALAATALTGDPVFDGIGSIAIGLLLGVSAIFLMNRNRKLLLGRSPREAVRQRLVEIVGADPAVDEIMDVKATLLGPDAVRFKAEIRFDGGALARKWIEGEDLEQLAQRLRSREGLEQFLEEYGQAIVDALGDAIDRIEARIRSEVPEAKHVDLETD